jgi:E3 ubiquitin-protein ligase HUWE1
LVLNELVSTNPAALNEEPYSILIKYPNVIDFQVKESYFRYRLKKKQQSSRHNRIRLHINRNLLFHDSFRQLQGHRGRDLRGKIDVQFQGEEGVDAGGLLREWYYKLSHEMVNMNYALFEQSNIGSETYQPSTKSSINPEHLQFFKFCGRICAKGIFDNQLLDCHFTRAFYKQVLGVPVHWRDMEAVDEALYKNLMWITENDITGILDLNMTVDMENFGAIETVELKPGGADIEVTETNKGEYVRLVCRQKLVLAIKDQMTNFLEGFYEVIPQSEIAIFNEKELEMVISGLPDVDVDDLKANTEYGSGYSPSSPQIQWFFRAVRTFGREENVRLVQFITGTGKIPVGGFAKLVGMSGPQKFNIHKDRNGADRLPQAHTCFNQLDLPEYESYDQLRKALLLAINEGSEGFGFA